MRKSLPKELREKYTALEGEVETQRFWLNEGWKFGPNDPDYVAFEDGLEDLDALIKEHGLIHDSVTYESLFLQDIRPIWAVWADE